MEEGKKPIGLKFAEDFFAYGGILSTAIQGSTGNGHVVEKIVIRHDYEAWKNWKEKRVIPDISPQVRYDITEKKPGLKGIGLRIGAMVGMYPPSVMIYSGRISMEDSKKASVKVNDESLKDIVEKAVEDLNKEHGTSFQVVPF